MSAEVSSNGGRTCRRTLVREYTFSAGDASFQREVQRLNPPLIGRPRSPIVPDKHGSGPAKLSSLRLFASEWSDT